MERKKGIIGKVRKLVSSGRSDKKEGTDYLEQPFVSWGFRAHQ